MNNRSMALRDLEELILEVSAGMKAITVIQTAIYGKAACGKDCADGLGFIVGAIETKLDLMIDAVSECVRSEEEAHE